MKKSLIILFLLVIAGCSPDPAATPTPPVPSPVFGGVLVTLGTPPGGKFHILPTQAPTPTETPWSTEESTEVRQPQPTAKPKAATRTPQALPSTTPVIATPTSPTTPTKSAGHQCDGGKIVDKSSQMWVKAGGGFQVSSYGNFAVLRESVSVRFAGKPAEFGRINGTNPVETGWFCQTDYSGSVDTYIKLP